MLERSNEYELSFLREKRSVIQRRIIFQAEYGIKMVLDCTENPYIEPWTLQENCQRGDCYGTIRFCAAGKILLPNGRAAQRIFSESV